MLPNCLWAFATAASTAALLPTSSARGRSRSPYFAFSASSDPTLRAAAATLSPRTSAASVQTYPKPLDAPVMNQTLWERVWGIGFCPPKHYVGKTEDSPLRGYIRRTLRFTRGRLGDIRYRTIAPR